MGTIVDDAMTTVALVVWVGTVEEKGSVRMAGMVGQPGGCGDSATFRLGLKNVLGSNWTHGQQRWSRRAPMLERELCGPDGMQAGIYFLLEVNNPPERRSLRSILRGWDVVRTRGRNDVYSDPAVHRLLSHDEIPLGTTTRQQRYVTVVRYEHVATGIAWTGATTHLSSSAGTTKEIAAASRELQGHRLAQLCREMQVDVLAADLNNVLVRPDTPRGILEDSGQRDWRAVVDVEHADHDTHHALGQPPTIRGKHLDAIYVASRVTVLDGRVQITEPESSDHFGLVCTVSVPR